jgi:hypothetical protein
MSRYTTAYEGRPSGITYPTRWVAQRGINELIAEQCGVECDDPALVAAAIAEDAKWTVVPATRP